MYRNERGRLWAPGAALGIAALAAPAAQAIVTVGTISTPTPNSRPTATAVAPNQTVWFTEEAASKLGYIDQASGFVHEFSWTTANVRPNALAIDSSGQVWFTEAGADQIGMYNPAANYLVEYYWGDFGLSGIEVTADGNVWFTMFNRSEIGVLNPSQLTISYYNWTSDFVGPLRIHKDGANRLWFTENSANRIGVLDPYFLYVYDYYMTGANSAPWGIAVDASQFVWFTDSLNGLFSQLDPNSGNINDFLTIGGAGSAPRDIATTTNPSGQTVVVWAESGGPGNIGVLNADTGSKMGVELSPSAQATGVAIDAQENAWFTETGLSEVGGFSLPSTSIARRLRLQGPGASRSPAVDSAAGFHLVLTQNNGKGQGKGKSGSRQANKVKKDAKRESHNVLQVKRYQPTKVSKKYR